MVLRLFPAVKLSPPSPPTWFSLVFAFCVLTTLPHAARATTISSLNPQVWFDSSSAGSVVLGTGSTLSQWNDVSGNDRHAGTNTGTSMPTFVNTTINGDSFNVINFNGSSGTLSLRQSMLVDWAPTKGNYTGFVIAQTSQARANFLAQDAGGYNNLDTAFGVGVQNVWGSVNSSTNNLLTLETHGPTSPTTNGARGGTVNDGQWHVFSFRVDGNQYEVGDNGLLTTNASSQAGVFGSISSQGLTIGGRQVHTNGIQLTGQIAEIAIFAGALSDFDFNAVGYSLADKYGIITQFEAPPAASVPEPSSIALLLLGSGFAAVYSHRRRRQRVS